MKNLESHNDAVRVQKTDIKPRKFTYEDAAHFKIILLQLICKGATADVEELLQSAPPFHEYPQFTDARVYKFNMFKADIHYLRETKTCSLVSIAVNVGELRLLEVILAYM